MHIAYSTSRGFLKEQVIQLYQSVGWSSAKKPDKLMAALANSQSVVTAWSGEKLVGLGNAISDGHLVVYYPHLVVDPNFQGKGIGTEIMRILKSEYKDFHQHTLLADGKAIDFYIKQGFDRAGSCVPMWIYAGDDHE